MTWRSWPEITNSSVFFVATCGISKLVCWNDCNALWKTRIYVRSSHNLWSPVCSLKLCHHFSTFESRLSIHWTHITLQQTTSFSAVSVSHFILLIFVFVWGFLMLQQWFHTVCQLAALRSLELTQRLLEVGTCWDTAARKKTVVFSEEFEKACGQEETQAALQKLLDRRKLNFFTYFYFTTCQLSQLIISAGFSHENTQFPRLAKPTSVRNTFIQPLILKGCHKLSCSILSFVS